MNTLQIRTPEVWSPPVFRVTLNESPLKYALQFPEKRPPSYQLVAGLEGVPCTQYLVCKPQVDVCTYRQLPV